MSHFLVIERIREHIFDVSRITAESTVWIARVFRETDVGISSYVTATRGALSDPQHLAVCTGLARMGNQTSIEVEVRS